MIVIRDKDSYGILSNGVLPLRVGDKRFPSVEHFRLVSMLADPVDQANVLSYVDVNEARVVFNRLDEEQYVGIIRRASERFYRKRLRTSARARTALRATTGAVRFCIEREDVPLKTVVGVVEETGYNVVGQSLEKIRHVLVSSAVGDDPILWRLFADRSEVEPKKASSHRERRLYRPAEINLTDSQKTAATRYYNRLFPEATTGGLVARPNRPVLQPSPQRQPDGDDPDDEYDEFAGGDDSENEEVPPVEKLVYRPIDTIRPPWWTKAVPWRYAPAGAYIDEEKWAGLENERLFIRDTSPGDPLAGGSIEDFTDALHVFKVFKAIEYLVGLIRGGVDIDVFTGKHIDAILWEGKVCVDIFFGKTLTPAQRREIYTRTWDRFRNGTLPHYDLVVKEILYPGNMVGFIRKIYLREINSAIGRKVRDILFTAFLTTVVRDEYPQVPPSLWNITVAREARGFSFPEFENMTDRLYHLVFSGRFILPPEDMERLRFFEAQRKTVEQIEQASHFLPSVPGTSCLDASGPLDPLSSDSISIEGKRFDDLFQYLYFSLLMFYGSLPGETAYSLLLDDKKRLLPGNHPLLQERLSHVIETRRMSVLVDALRLKAEQYPQIREILLYLRSAGVSDVRFDNIIDIDTWKAWSRVEFPVEDKILMDLAVSLMKKDFEKSVFLYFIMADLFRSMSLMTQLYGKRLDEKMLPVFIKCVGGYLRALREDDEEETNSPIPPIFMEYMEKKKIVVEKMWSKVWSLLSGLVREFSKKSFRPSVAFQQAKEGASAPSEMEIARSLVRLVSCLYRTDADVGKADLHVLVEMITGSDTVAPWVDSSFEIRFPDNDEDDKIPLKATEVLPTFILERLHFRKKKKKGSKKDRVAQYNLIHPEIQPETLAFLRDTFKGEGNVSRLSYAIVATRNNLTNPRRIRVFLE